MIRPDGLYKSQQRFGLYRWHIMDPDPLPARPAGDDPGAGLAHGDKDGAYLPLQDDIASVAFWYQTLPTAPFPTLPGRGLSRNRLAALPCAHSICAARTS